MRKTNRIVNAFLVIGIISYSCNSESRDDVGNVSDQFITNTVVTLDLSNLNDVDVSDKENACQLWDKMHVISTLQGVVNRESPQLYLFYVENQNVNIDRYWWNKYRQDGEWISKANVVVSSNIINVVEIFKDKIKGAVVYDPNVDATSNIASSIAGVEDLIAVRYDLSPKSMYSQLILQGPKIPVKISLVKKDGTSLFTGEGRIPGTNLKSTGSAKNDAYCWFIENYMKPGRMNTAFGAYYIDQYWIKKAKLGPANHHTLSNHDFFVSKRGFFYDLSPWLDEKATDDPNQSVGADCKLLKDMLLIAYRKNDDGKIFTYLGGFPPWAYKYTQHAGGKHEDVETEWEYSYLISSYNGFKDADAIGYGALANASFWQHFPLQKEYPQKWISQESLQKKGYLGKDGKLTLGNKELLIFYVGDYDASSWLSQTTPVIWDDPQRGKIPLMWCISPVLAERVPMAWDYRRITATENDYFVAADNGAGYLNPGELQEPRSSGLPSGTEDWAEHCKPYYQQWGLTVTGFIIDGFAKALNEDGLKAYADFSPNGIVPQKTANMLYEDMPIFCADWDINDEDPKIAAAKIASRVKERTIPFHWFRNILKTPSWYVQVVEELKLLNPNIELVDAPTFFELYKIFVNQECK